MKVSDIMTRDVLTVGKDNPLGTTLELMHKHGISKLPVVHQGKFIGIVSDGDIVDELGALRNKGLVPNALHVSGALRKEVPTIGPDVSIDDARNLFQTTGAGILPVVDEEWTVVGVLTKADLLPFVRDETPVKEFMKRDLYAVSPNDRVIHARRVMLDHGVERLPVLDGGKLVGIVGEIDLAMGFSRVKQVFEDNRQDKRIRDLHVADVMTAPVVTGTPDMRAQEAAALMKQEDVGALPLVERGDRIAGMITRTDLLPFARE
ncbi:MAG TPA: CBS domain-containing protein [Candidatus Thermoplasmatota archaeon]|nr:CBS domain-containing protein [Candidatus Thermoplasmatota archaeon]